LADERLSHVVIRQDGAVVINQKPSSQNDHRKRIARVGKQAHSDHGGTDALDDVWERHCQVLSFE
jgi:hypothetical protein